MDKIIGVAATREKLPQIIKEISLGERYIITQRSKAKAMIVSLEEIETLEILADKKLLRDIVAAKEDIKNKRYKSYEEYFGSNP
jgi:prevent-host-death family protein